MMSDSSVSEQTYEYFSQEATELLDTMERELQGLRQDFSLQKVHALMRAAHTLKGASASVGLDTLQKTTHSLEGVFKALCYPDTVVSVEMERLIFESYDCLQLLLSSQLAASQVDEADILDRMAAAIAQLEEMLGDRFGKEGHLPTSSELGFDMTQSIFELGVAQRIDALSSALENPNLEELRGLLETQVEVFVGLGESLNLPGFEEIASLTGQALQQHPDRILEIAPVALENFRTAQMAVLGGDRTQGGSPSAALQQFCDRTQPLTVDARATVDQSITEQTVITAGGSANRDADRSHQRSWLRRRWQMLMNPLGRRNSDRKPQNTAPPDLPAIKAPTDTVQGDETRLDEIQTDAVPTGLDAIEPGAIAEADTELAALAPAELRALDVQPQIPEPSLNLSPLADDESAQLASASASTQPESAANLNNRSDATIRMSIEHVEQLSQTMGELLMQQNRQMLYHEQLTSLIKKLTNRIAQQQQQLNQQRDQHIIHKEYAAESISAAKTADISALNSAYGQFDAIELDSYSDIQLLLQSCLEETVQQSESAEAIELFLRHSGQSLEKQKRLLSNTRETLLEARMVPLKKVFERFQPALRRLKSQHDKQVEIETSGGDILVDKAIADNLYEPLLHLIRNAFDHGIESVETRLSQRKSPVGRIFIEGTQQGRHLLISVQDDGQGLDLEKIRRQAVEKQLVEQTESDSLTPEQTVDLLFEAGFSTASETDMLSGRGVGLDVVQARIQSLQGWVTVEHEPDAGTCFTLQIPATLTIAKLLLCQAQERTYALIADAIEHILIPSAQQVRVWKGGKMLTWQTNDEEYLVPVNALDEVLHYASPMSNPRLAANGKRFQETATNPVILLHHDDALVGLEVDQLLGEQELVISPLGQTIVPPAYLYGSSILPNGQLTLVLDGLMLAKIIVEQRQHNLKMGAASRSSTPAAPENKPIFVKKQVLTVDDSITVRQTLVEALQKANYQVIQARDGVEALAQLERYPDIQAILCDIEMPRMNGFEFLKARQQKTEIAAIPTIMLTSRMGDKHRMLTEELGATTYITKPYLTPELIKTIDAAIETQTHSPLTSTGDLHTAKTPHPVGDSRE